MSVLVTGATGQLGSAMMRELHRRGIAATGVSTRDFDLTDGACVQTAVARIAPEVIVHCAAYTDVNRAESDAQKCMAVNAQGTRHLAEAARATGAAMLYVSTDYVFDGTGDAPWETDAPCAPLNVYGLSKWQGEQAVADCLSRYYILRTSWVFGLQGGNFVRTMLRLGRERDVVRVVDDQRGAPTYAEDLARLMADLITTERYGVYHAANGGECSFAEFARAIMQGAGIPCRVEPIATADYPSPARRPLNSRLSMRSLDAAGLTRLPLWQDALDRFLQAVGEKA